MTEAPGNDSQKELRQRLAEIDDAFTVRALAVLDVADELHHQTNERIDRLAVQIDRNALAIAQLALSVQQMVTNANADRAVMLEILQYLRNQYPGNGQGGS